MNRSGTKGQLRPGKQRVETWFGLENRGKISQIFNGDLCLLFSLLFMCQNLVTLSLKYQTLHYVHKKILTVAFGFIQLMCTGTTPPTSGSTAPTWRWRRPAVESSLSTGSSSMFSPSGILRLGREEKMFCLACRCLYVTQMSFVIFCAAAALQLSPTFYLLLSVLMMLFL